MRKSKYSFFEEIDDGVFLHYSALTNIIASVISWRSSLYRKCSSIIQYMQILRNKNCAKFVLMLKKHAFYRSNWLFLRLNIDIKCTNYNIGQLVYIWSSWRRLLPMPRAGRWWCRWRNFSVRWEESLNFPADHPARDMQDTFFIGRNPDVLLRTHSTLAEGAAFAAAEIAAYVHFGRRFCEGEVATIVWRR